MSAATPSQPWRVAATTRGPEPSCVPAHASSSRIPSAIDRSERFRSFAAEDSDFDPIRGEPAFKELVG